MAPTKQRYVSESPPPQRWCRNLAGCWGAASDSHPSTDFRSMVLSIMLYGCEAWILWENIEKHIQAFRWNSRGSCYASLKLHGTQYTWVRAEQGREPCGSQGTSSCHCRAMEADAWFGHVTCLGKLASREGTIDCIRGWGRQRKNCAHNTIHV